MRSQTNLRECSLLCIKHYVTMLPILSMLILLLTPSCTAGFPEGPSQMIDVTQPANPTISPTTSSHPQQTHQPLEAAGGPYLLIQTNFSDYQILNLSTGTAAPFIPPDQNSQQNLGAALSPSGQKMFFLMNDDSITLSDLITGEYLHTLTRKTNTSNFHPDLAFDEVKSIGVPEYYTDQEILSYIEKTYQDSIANVRWVQSDRYWLLPLNASPTSTTLTLHDLETKTYKNLESQPALVEDYWVAPNKENILLKKGFINEPGFWGDDCYYILNTNNFVVQSIPLPDDVDAPTLFWINPGTVGIIHQMGFIGGENFSIFDVHSGELQHIFTGSFTHIQPYADGFITLQENQEENTTNISFITPLGETINEKIIDDRCFYKGMLEQSLLLICQSESYLLDQEHNLTPFGDVITLLSTAPNGSYTVFVNREGAVILLEHSTQNQLKVDVDGIPLEVRWLPDSSGFLYRTNGKLFWFDLVNKESQHLLTSDFFSDYRNLNAVWVKTP